MSQPPPRHYDVGHVENGYVLGPDLQWHRLGDATTPPAGSVPTVPTAGWNTQAATVGFPPGSAVFGAPTPPPIPPRSGWWTRGRIVAVAAGAVGLCAVAVVAVVAVVNALSAPAPGADGDQVLVLDEPAQVGVGTFTVHGLECGVMRLGEDAWAEEPEGQFCMLSMTVLNSGTVPMDVWPEEQRLFAATGQEYAFSAAGMYAMEPADWMMGPINPGIEAEVLIPFDVPVDFVPGYVTVSDGDWYPTMADVPLG